MFFSEWLLTVLALLFVYLDGGVCYILALFVGLRK